MYNSIDQCRDEYKWLIFEGLWKDENFNFIWKIFCLTCKFTVSTELIFVKGLIPHF